MSGLMRGLVTGLAGGLAGYARGAADKKEEDRRLREEERIKRLDQQSQDRWEQQMNEAVLSRKWRENQDMWQRSREASRDVNDTLEMFDRHSDRLHQRERDKKADARADRVESRLGESAKLERDRLQMQLDEERRQQRIMEAIGNTVPRIGSVTHDATDTDRMETAGMSSWRPDGQQGNNVPDLRTLDYRVVSGQPREYRVYDAYRDIKDALAQEDPSAAAQFVMSDYGAKFRQHGFEDMKQRAMPDYMAVRNGRDPEAAKRLYNTFYGNGDTWKEVKLSADGESYEVVSASGARAKVGVNDFLETAAAALESPDGVASLDLYGLKKLMDARGAGAKKATEYAAVQDTPQKWKADLNKMLAEASKGLRGGDSAQITREYITRNGAPDEIQVEWARELGSVGDAELPAKAAEMVRRGIPKDYIDAIVEARANAQ